jgi:sulfoxide reductase heme-binding subunit YedZ
MSTSSNSAHQTSAPMFSGWKLTAALTVALLAMTAVIFASDGVTEEAVRVLIRATARTSLALFTLTFVTSSLHQIWRSSTTRFLRKNRRYVGLAFTSSHVIHLAAILSLARWFPQPFVSDVPSSTVIFGSLGYVVLAVMTLTSTNQAQKALGKRWQQLHRWGSYYLWIVFAVSYWPRAFADPTYVTYALVVAASPLIRLAASRTARTQET